MTGLVGRPVLGVAPCLGVVLFYVGCGLPLCVLRLCELLLPLCYTTATMLPHPSPPSSIEDPREVGVEEMR